MVKPNTHPTIKTVVIVLGFNDEIFFLPLFSPRFSMNVYNEPDVETGINNFMKMAVKTC